MHIHDIYDMHPVDVAQLPRIGDIVRFYPTGQETFSIHTLTGRWEDPANQMIYCHLTGVRGAVLYSRIRKATAADIRETSSWLITETANENAA